MDLRDVIKDVQALCPETCLSDVDMSTHAVPLGLRDYAQALSGRARDLICDLCEGKPELPCCHNHPHRRSLNQGHGRALAAICVEQLYGLDFRGFAGPDPCLQANVEKDPHLHLARGGRADFRGHDGKYYCFLSAPRLAINIKTEDATFRLHNLYDKGGTLVVEGSFITEAQPANPVGLQVTRRERVMTSSLRRCRCILWHASVGGRTSSAAPRFGRASSSAMPEDRTRAPISP